MRDWYCPIQLLFSTFRIHSHVRKIHTLFTCLLPPPLDGFLHNQSHVFLTSNTSKLRHLQNQTRCTDPKPNLITSKAIMEMIQKNKPRRTHIHAVQHNKCLQSANISHSGLACETYSHVSQFIFSMFNTEKNICE